MRGTGASHTLTISHHHYRTSSEKDGLFTILVSASTSNFRIGSKTGSSSGSGGGTRVRDGSNSRGRGGIVGGGRVTVYKKGRMLR